MARMPEANKLELKAMLVDELGTIIAARPDLGSAGGAAVGGVGDVGRTAEPGARSGRPR